MKLLEQLVQTEASRIVGWTLAHSLWEGALAAALLAMALPFLRTSRARYAATCLVLGSMALAVGLTLSRLIPSGSTAAGRTVAGLLLPPIPDVTGTISTTGIRGVEGLLAWLAPLWAVGVALFHLRLLASWMAASRITRRGVCAAPAVWEKKVADLCLRLRVSKPVVLLESAIAESPVVIGHIRPVILMPVGLLAGMTPNQIEMILAHELAHVKRHDYLINVLQTFVEGLLFYHPAVWWISGVMRREREHCCDDVALEVSGDAYAYASTLAALERTRWAATQTAMAAAGGSVTERVRRLIKPEINSSGGWSSMVVLAVLGACGVLAAAQLKTVAPAPGITRPAIALAPQQAAAEASPYEKWLNNDVVYIVNKVERYAFGNLKTNEEREKFIEQFWQWRDPTPDTPHNEYKEEHYRRIAYVNARFGADVEGWRTDRGRIYIVYGPPDEIESHPSGGRYRRPANEGGGEVETVPFERWRYNYLEGVGTQVIIEFVDAKRDGRYRQTVDPVQKVVTMPESKPRP
jgi:GWxTD domain-containing protein